MLIDAIRTEYEKGLATARLPRGNPTGSRWGKCLAQSQMLQHPELSHPKPYPLRSTLTFQLGDLVEAWWRQKALALYGNRVGLSQAVFYFPAWLRTAGEREALAWRLKGRKLWGRMIPGFEPPYVKGTEGGRVKVRVPGWYGREDSEDLRKLGFVLDPRPRAGAPEGTLWAPAYIDWVLLHPEHGPVIYEAKSMSDYAFRRAIVGTLGLDYQLQLAGMVAASGLDACWALYRKETSHIAEVLYTRRATRTEVTLTLLNGQRERWLVVADQLRPESGAGPALSAKAFLEQRGEVLRTAGTLSLGEAQWWGASVWTPYDAGVLDRIRDRILAVLLFDADPGPEGYKRWTREYGPSFTCGKCAGAGARPCSSCKGSGVTAKLKKPCGAQGCRGGRVACDACGGTGQVDRAELRYPCSYCPVVDTCWAHAGLTLELDSKPHYYVTRAAYEAAGLSFTPAEAPEELPTPVADTPEAGDVATAQPELRL
jgi:hypothetical protein